MAPADKIRVLLVDDDVVDRKNIARMLATDDQTQYQIIDADTAQKAITQLETEAFDVCIVDYYLSSHTGLELLDTIKYLAPRTSIIMLTGVEDKGLDILSFEAGASSFLNKSSLTPELLKRSIRYAIYHKGVSVESESLAYYDPLTKLANRSLFLDRLASLMTHSAKKNRTHAILYLDLDYFKQVNENHGRPIGDAVLQQMAALLLDSVKTIDTVARISGDRFALILEDVSQDEAIETSKRIIDSTQYPFLINQLTLLARTSIGIVLFTDDEVDKTEYEHSMQQILEQASQALSHAKALGRSCYYLFDDKLDQLTKEHNAFIQELRSAVENGEIFPHYQPQYCLKSGRIEAFEALARWQRTELDLIYPQYFINQIEELKLMPILTRGMIKKVCADLAKWSKTNPDIKATVNISSNSRVNSYLLDIITDSIQEYNIRPEQLELEFDALTLVTNPELTSATLEELDQLGINITINNFGKGDISLFSLAELPISTLKIDMSLIHDIGVSTAKDTIVKVVIDIAKQFALKTVAVGVEKKKQTSFLKKNGCDKVQGYLYSRALSFDESNALLKEM